MTTSEKLQAWIPWAAVLGGAATLLVELRWEHRIALGEEWPSWLPLIWLGLVLLSGALALAAGGRAIALLRAVCAAGLLLGPIGVLVHTGGKPVKQLGKVLGAWTIARGQDGGEKPGERPPALAPLGIAGLGLAGALALRKRPGDPR